MGMKVKNDSRPIPAGRERIHHWWRAAEWHGPRAPGGVQASKPNVSFRKIVNTALPDGTTLGVNAQCYALLVTDVPDLKSERRKCVPEFLKYAPLL